MLTISGYEFYGNGKASRLIALQGSKLFGIQTLLASKGRFQIKKSKNVMEISMSGLTPPPSPPPMMEFFFSILMDIRPFFENTLKNFHFAL